jgi:hypothetical protein
MSKLIKRSKLRALLVSMLLIFTIVLNPIDTNNKSFVVTAASETNKAVTLSTKNQVKYAKFNGKSYKVISVKGGDLSGKRLPNVAVDIGYGSRVYWGFTNKYGQLVYVVADKITIQDSKTEKVLKNGRYYKDEAKVPGTERKDLDEGHVIADSLGGVSNAYNITPQNSTLNRHGDQAYMEKVIRDAGGCTDFVATITYPDTKTQIPSHYKYTYKINGEGITDSFDNVDPDEANKPLISVTPKPTVVPTATPKPTIIPTPIPTPTLMPTPIPTQMPTNEISEATELRKVDTNGNGRVTIAEAEVAGFSMPIYSNHWLYKYMTDSDGDGMVGE